MKVREKEAQARYLKRIEIARSCVNSNPFETKEEQNAAIERAKSHIVSCVNRYFPHYATSPSADFQIYFANKVKKDQIIKAFAEWGRGLAKSVWCDIIIPFWLWLNDQAHYMVLVGQNNDVACQLLDDLQAEFESNPQILADFGEQKVLGAWETGAWQTKGCPQRGLKPFIARARGVRQPVRGLRIGSQRPNLIVIDDIETEASAKNPKMQDAIANWIKSALLKTMDGEIRRMLFANNRFAPRMVQTVLQKEQPKWWVSHIKAYNKVTYEPAWWQKYSPQYYKEIEADGILEAWAEYLMEPHVKGKIFTENQFVWDKLPRLDHFKAIVGHWDIAYAGNESSDFNAVRIWGLCKNNLFWYIQGFCKQTKMAAAVNYIAEVHKQTRNVAVINWQLESQFWNDEVNRVIREVSVANSVDLSILKVAPVGNKYNRMLTMQPRYQNNRIRFNKNMQADNDTIVGNAQVMGLEPGYSTKDDAPDADQNAIAALEKYIYVGTESDEITQGRMEHNHERI